MPWCSGSRPTRESTTLRRPARSRQRPLLRRVRRRARRSGSAPTGGGRGTSSATAGTSSTSSSSGSPSSPASSSSRRAWARASRRAASRRSASFRCSGPTRPATTRSSPALPGRGRPLAVAQRHVRAAGRRDPSRDLARVPGIRRPGSASAPTACSSTSWSPTRWPNEWARVPEYAVAADRALGAGGLERLLDEFRTTRGRDARRRADAVLSLGRPLGGRVTAA